MKPDSDPPDSSPDSSDASSPAPQALSRRTFALGGASVAALSGLGDAAPAQDPPRIRVTGRARAIPLRPDDIDEVRQLIGELNRSYKAGLADRARVVGYHREVMILQTGGAQGDFLNIYLDFNDEKDIAPAVDRLMEYGKNPTPFTKFWSARFAALSAASGAMAGVAEPLLSWEDRQVVSARRAAGIPLMVTRSVTAPKLDALRSLLRELQADDRWNHWVARARAVGCYEQLICVQHFARGIQIVIYSEGEDSELGRRLLDYRKAGNDFARWWYPRLNAVLGDDEWSGSERYETLFDWTDEQWHPS